MNKIILLLFLAIIFLQPALAAHYIVGIVNNASDGQPANGKEVVLWNPGNGIDDNLTDTIGPAGSSGASNVYMVDCELLGSPCNVGEELRVKVTDSGDNYLSYWVNVSVTGAGYDIAPNITLNSIPNSALVSPDNYENFSDAVTFNCSASDLDGLSNITLYGNWSSGWHANETKGVSGKNNQTFFVKNLTEGKYLWACIASDNVSVYNFSVGNYTVTIDRTRPLVYSVSVNESYICGDTLVRVNCSSNDSFTKISNVVLEAISPTYTKNYSASILSGITYYSDILINETGIWKFNCIANDSADNFNNLTSYDLMGYSSGVDFYINGSEINFSSYSPIENDGVVVESVVYNLGCSEGSALVGFYKDELSKGIQIGGNQSLLISGRGNKTTNVTWVAEIGTTLIQVFADLNDSVSEEKENNNIGNKTIYVGAWQDFYGNISFQRIIADNQSSNLSAWKNITSMQGNIFVTDKEADVDWNNLSAIGINNSGDATGDDFNEIDSMINMTSFNDSVFNTFTNSGVPKSTDSFLVHQKIIENVPVVNSTNNSNFITGILWDASDDNDGGFSQEDKEDLVFIARINKMAEGMFGNYDYEIKIPVRLREYDSSDEIEVYLYYDIS